jgi:hypothetical protein
MLSACSGIGGNGLARGAVAGPLHRATDRPLSRPTGQIPWRPSVASRALRGPADRPVAALTGPRHRGPVATGRLRRAESGRPAATHHDSAGIIGMVRRPLVRR